MKTILNLCTVILAAFVLTGCGDNSADRKVYELEKLYSKASETEKKLLGIKPELATAEDLRAVAEQYQLLINKYKITCADLAQKDSLTENDLSAMELAGAGQLKIAELMLAARDTAAAKTALADFEVIFPKNRGQQINAWIMLARIFAAEERLDKVEQIYLRLIEKYDPPADIALNPILEILGLPFDLARYFALAGDSVKTVHYLQYSENYYSRLRTTYPQTNLAISATRFLAETYKIMGQSQKAIELLQAVTDSTGRIAMPALLLTAQTYFENLRNPEKALEHYQMALDREPDTSYTPRVLMEMGQIYLLERRFAEAREKFQKLIDQFPQAIDYLPMALRHIGISYDEEKEYSRALDAYTALIEKYPTHSQTFETYIYLPKFFEKQDQKQLRDQWYKRAEEFFRETRQKYETRALGAAGQEFLARLYITYSAWPEAIQALKDLIRDFSRYRFAAEAYFRIGTIFENELNMPDSAKTYYRRQIEAYPNSGLSKAAENKLKSL